MVLDSLFDYGMGYCKKNPRMILVLCHASTLHVLLCCSQRARVNSMFIYFLCLYHTEYLHQLCQQRSRSVSPFYDALEERLVSSTRLAEALSSTDLMLLKPP